MNPEVLGEDWRVGMLPFILEVVDYDFQNIVVGLALIRLTNCFYTFITSYVLF